MSWTSPKVKMQDQRASLVNYTKYRKETGYLSFSTSSKNVKKKQYFLTHFMRPILSYYRTWQERCTHTHTHTLTHTQQTSTSDESRCKIPANQILWCMKKIIFDTTPVKWGSFQRDKGDSSYANNSRWYTTLINKIKDKNYMITSIRTENELIGYNIHLLWKHSIKWLYKESTIT